MPLRTNWVDGVAVAPGEVVVLENCRLNKGEKKNDPALAKKMAALCDIYVNDAFGTAHRAEASTYGIAEFAKVACAGPLLAAEIDAITKALGRAEAAAGRDRRRLQGLDQAGDPAEPGRARSIGSSSAAASPTPSCSPRALPIGKSLAEPALVGEARAVIAAMKARGAEVPLPVDVVTAQGVQGRRGGDDEGGRRRERRRPDPRHRPEERRGARRACCSRRERSSGTARSACSSSTPSRTAPRRSRARSPRSPAFSLAGGGDTLAAIAKYGIADKIDYISTGGGAFLEVLEGKTLPALEILERRARADGVSRMRAGARVDCRSAQREGH